MSGAARLKRRPLQVVGQGPVVEERIVAAQRQLEAVLASWAPWQVPALQPMRDRIGITSRTKLTSYFSFCPVTLTGIVSRLAGEAELERAAAVGHRPDQARSG